MSEDQTRARSRRARHTDDTDARKSINSDEDIVSGDEDVDMMDASKHRRKRPGNRGKARSKRAEDPGNSDTEDDHPESEDDSKMAEDGSDGRRRTKPAKRKYRIRSKDDKKDEAGDEDIEPNDVEMKENSMDIVESDKENMASAANAEDHSDSEPEVQPKKKNKRAIVKKKAAKRAKPKQTPYVVRQLGKPAKYRPRLTKGRTVMYRLPKSSIWVQAWIKDVDNHRDGSKSKVLIRFRPNESKRQYEEKWVRKESKSIEILSRAEKVERMHAVIDSDESDDEM